MLDSTDREILVGLQADARISNKELAASVGLSPSSCLERVRRLRESGVLTGFHAEVDPRAVGIRLQALVMVRLTKHSRKVVESFRDEMLAMEEVIGTYLVAGGHDFLIHCAVPDSDHLKNFELEHITSRSEVVHVETSLIFEHRRSPVLPYYGD